MAAAGTGISAGCVAGCVAGLATAVSLAVAVDAAIIANKAKAITANDEEYLWVRNLIAPYVLD
jgi:hypothetical protein